MFNKVLKQTLLFILSVCLTLCVLCGCDFSSTSNEDNNADTDTNTQQNNEKNTTTNEFKTVTIVDDDEICAKITSYEFKSYSGASFSISLENKTDKNLMFSIDNASVNDIMCDPFWAKEVVAGKKAISTISWYSSKLEDAGITTVSKFEFEFTVDDSDDWLADDLFNDIITINV